MSRLLVSIVLLAGCGDPEPADEDGDGFAAEADCDDSDPAVNPGADEVPYDEIDQNCDASDDASFAFERVPGSLDGPRPAGPRWTRDGDTVQLYAVYASESTNESAWSRATFDGDTADVESDEFEVIESDTLSISIGRTLEAVVRPGGDGLLATSIVTDEGNLRASLLEIDVEGGWQWAGNGPGDTTEHFVDTAIAQDGDDISVVGCGSEGIRWLTGAYTTFFDLEFTTAIGEESVEACEVLGGEMRARHEDGTVVSYTADGEVLVIGDDEWADVTDMQWDEDGFLLVQDDVLVFDGGDGLDVIPTSEVPERARFDLAPDERLFVAYATAAGDLFLLSGPVGGPFTESRLQEDFARADLDVEASRRAVFVGARSGSDVWMAAVQRPD